MTMLPGETMCRCVMMKSLIVKDAARSKGKALFEFTLAKADPGGVVQTSNHKSPVINTHPLNRSLIFVSRMIIRDPIWIDSRASEKRRIVGTRDIGPDEFVK